MSKAGTLDGVTGIPTSHSVLIKPYALAGEQSGSALPDVISGTNADVGFDLKYGLTPGLTLDGTFNTDFSQRRQLGAASGVLERAFTAKVTRLFGF